MKYPIPHRPLHYTWIIYYQENENSLQEMHIKHNIPSDTALTQYVGSNNEPTTHKGYINFIIYIYICMCVCVCYSVFYRFYPFELNLTTEFRYRDFKVRIEASGLLIVQGIALI